MSTRGPRSELPSRDEAATLVAAHPWWYHTFEISPGVVTRGVYDISRALQNMGLPYSMEGLRVLEIGPADGAFTKAMWERGADVIAVDYEHKASFDLMRRLSGCTATYIQCNVLDIVKLDLGTFDYVLLMGVLYHLPDPLRGLWLMRRHMRADSVFILETLISTREGPPIMEYFPSDTHNSDITNFWAPNVQCCKDMMADCGLVVDRGVAGGARAIFHAHLNPAPGSEFKAAFAYSHL